VLQCVAVCCSVLQCVAVRCTCTLVSVDASPTRERTPNACPAKTASFASSDAPQHSASTSRTMSCCSVFFEGNKVFGLGDLYGCVFMCLYACGCMCLCICACLCT